MASSRSRPVPRASSRLPTLAAAMSSTRTTAPIRSHSEPRTSWVRRCCIGVGPRKHRAVLARTPAWSARPTASRSRRASPKDTPFLSRASRVSPGWFPRSAVRPTIRGPDRDPELRAVRRPGTSGASPRRRSTVSRPPGASDRERPYRAPVQLPRQVLAQDDHRRSRPARSSSSLEGAADERRNPEHAEVGRRGLDDLRPAWSARHRSGSPPASGRRPSRRRSGSALASRGSRDS